MVLMDDTSNFNSTVDEILGNFGLVCNQRDQQLGVFAIVECLGNFASSYSRKDQFPQGFELPKVPQLQADSVNG